MQPKIKYILITILSVVAVMYLLTTMKFFSGGKNYSVCKELQVKLDDANTVKLISEQEIAQLLAGVGLNPIGKSYPNIRTEKIERTLRNHPMIKRAECYKTSSGIVHINVLQRSPKFRVVGHQSYYIDQDKEKMPISPHYAAYIPVVSGRVTLSMAKGPIYDFVSFLEKNEFWNAQIVQINIREDSKVELVPRVGDAIILLGSFERYEAKLKKLEKLYTKGFNVVGWNKYKVINLEYKDQVVCSRSEFIPHPPVTDSVSIEVKDSIIAKKI
jgi:cell division protein FtsQ